MLGLICEISRGIPERMTHALLKHALGLALAVASGLAGAQAPAAAPAKVLRYAFPVAETGFDPAQISDLYSAQVVANLFDAPYKFDYLARPATIVPNLAEALPEVADNHRTFTFRLRPGIYFADDPAFGGTRRELVAQDVVYSLKRFYDPKNKSPRLSGLQEEGILGLDELRQAAAASGRFDYDAPVEGARALDRYTVQLRTAQPRPRFINLLADPAVLGIVAREVVERYGERIMEHPVGTGAFMLGEWKRSSKITLVRNPGYRDERYDARPAAGDAAAQAIAQRMQGRRLPMVDRVEVSIIDEPQPRWLAFLNNEHDLMERLPEAYAHQAIPNNRIAPNLERRGITMERVPLSDVTYFWFRMDHPVVGGYTPDKVALRRAIALAHSAEAEIRLSRRGQAIAAQGPVMPQTLSYDPGVKTVMGRHDPARAKALLDMYGYTDKDADGWRDLPDGQPLVLEMNTIARADYREKDELMKKQLNAVGIRINFVVGKFPEQLKAARAGKLMMWQLGLSAGSTNSGGVLELGNSAAIGQLNHARFNLPAFDALHRRQSQMPDGPERDAVIREAARLLVAYMPYKFVAHRIGTDLMQPWLHGYRRHPVLREFWKYVDVDPERAPR